MRELLDRRGFLAKGAALIGAVTLAGCDRLAGTPFGQRALKAGEDANLYVQRLLLSPASLAAEFPDSMISKDFKPNGTTDPQDTDYVKLVKSEFSGFTLMVDGLVETPFSLSLPELKALPSRTQVTRHDCVEGWSSIGKWTGVPLADLLQKAKLKPLARYVVFHCFDTMEYAGGGLEGGESADSGDADTAAQPKGRPIRYYESLDLTDAYHPQTILAYAMNGGTLTVPHGAPLRLRVERQLGYKQAKYLRRVEVVASLEKFGDGLGGYWEDRGYEWYAGI